MNIQEVAEYLSVKRKERLENAVFGEIKEMVKDNEHFTTIELNEKAIVEALEKQTPKKLKVETSGGRHGIVSFYYFCPSCNSFRMETKKYCSNCGQALDWGETLREYGLPGATNIEKLLDDGDNTAHPTEKGGVE